MYPKFRVWNHKKEKMIYKVMVGNCDPNDKNWTCPVVYEEGIGWYHFEDFKYITQSTHTFDKNKKEIFEGDVLQIEQKPLFVSVYIVITKGENYFMGTDSISNV